MKVPQFLAIVVITLPGILGAKILFQDNFDTWDPSKWEHVMTLSGEGNYEFEYYWNNRTTSYVTDGKFYITPGYTSDLIGEANVESGFTLDIDGAYDRQRCTDPTNWGCSRSSGSISNGNYINPITSARINTQNSFFFKHGRVEMVAKLPQGDWLWPAFWLMPRYFAYGNWPASGEIDIMESRGNVGYPTSSGGGPNSFGSTLHLGPYYTEDHYINQVYTNTESSTYLADDFHTYGLFKNETYMYTYLDDDSNRVLEIDLTESFWEIGNYPSYFTNPWQYGGTGAPFDQEFFIIINLACGGTNGYFPDDVGSKPWDNDSPHASADFWNNRAEWQYTWENGASNFIIDSVTVYDVEDNDSDEM